MTRLDGSPSPSPAPASPTVAWPMTASLDGNAAHNISDTVEALRAARPQTVHGGKASSMLPALLSPRPAKGNEFGPTKISFSSRKWRDVGVNPPVTTMGESSADGFIYTWPPPPPPRPLTSSSIKSLLLQKPPKPEAYQHERSNKMLRDYKSRLEQVAASERRVSDLGSGLRLGSPPAVPSVGGRASVAQTREWYDEVQAWCGSLATDLEAASARIAKQEDEIAAEKMRAGNAVARVSQRVTQTLH